MYVFWQYPHQLAANTKKHTIVNSIEATSANAQLDSQDSDQELPDCMLHPQLYALDINNF